MAAAAGATISSCFSKCINNPKPNSSDCSVFIASCARTLQVASISHSHSLESFSINHKWRSPRVLTAVVQEELEGAIETEQVVEEKEEKPSEPVVEERGEAEDAVETRGEAEDAVETSPPTNTKLYFGNLPYNCDSSRLAGIIQDYGSPELVEVLYDRNTGRSRGFAFVTMSSVEDCNAVIENLDGSQYGGRTLRVNFSDKPKPKEPLYPETEFKLFVGNLSWSATSESLTELFQEFGNVVGARVLYDGDTGRSRGYGFVCYSTKEEMDAALESLNGAELEGRAIRVSLAQGKRT